MNEYYERLDRLREMLEDRGFAARARELLIAERSASTSGEAISVTGVLLRQILESTDVAETDLRAELTEVLELGQLLWDESNRSR